MGILGNDAIKLMYLLLAFVILGIIISLAIQGWMIMNEEFGYHEDPKIPLTNNHPEMDGYKPGDKLLVAKFDDLDLINLRNRMLRSKMDELFEEPSTFEDDDDDDGGLAICRR